jgi:hypothetical protein
MIKSMEIRYQYNMDKLPTYYKAKSQYSVLESMGDAAKRDFKRKLLNTLMAETKHCFEIESDFALKEFNPMKADTGSLSENRSDVKAIEKNNCLKSVED